MYAEFLQTLVSPSGFNCITEIHQKETGGTWAANNAVRFSDIAATDGLIAHLQSRGVSTYFGLAAYATLRDDGKVKRTQDNVVALRALWLDIDAGAEKFNKHGAAVYQTQQEALDALNGELAKGVLPPPTYIVSSGEGLHVYWASTEDITPAEWRPVADKLGKYCASVGLKVDTARTTDHASVLRPVGTTHFSSGKTVSILTTGAMFTKAQLVSAMHSLPVAGGLYSAASAASAVTGLGERPQYMMTAGATGSSMDGMTTYPPASFGKIIERQQHTFNGCPQLMYCYQEQATLPEPLWFKALSVAQFCTTDRDDWIHKLSQFHPAYERGETEAKAAQAKGPAPCAAFDAERPGVCNTCPHYGKISNPIVLGYEPHNRPTIVIAPIGTDKTKTEQFLIPELPHGFHRGANGGVYTYVPVKEKGGKGKDGDEDMQEFCVVKEDMYMFERVKDGQGRQMYMCRYHSPHDGVVEFQLDSSTIHSVSKEFKDAITGAGLPIHGIERWKLLMTFLNLSRTAMIQSRAAVEAVTQMGWQQNGKDFVLGDTVITRVGSRPAPLGDLAIARKFAKAFKPSADGELMDTELELWNTTLAEMYGDPKAVANQFVICTALGAPFSTRFALESHAGGIISLASSGSGHGKTFTCQTALRVFGDPQAATFSSKDGVTLNALMSNLGYLNSLPLLRDEITEMSPEDVVNMVYDSTRLGDKERAQGSSNDIRENRNRWRTFFYATGNTSMYDMIAFGREVADGPTRRVTELQIPELDYLKDNDYARRLAKKLSGIRGVAGKRLIEWIVRNDEEAQNLWENMMTFFIQHHGITNEERYWVNHLVSGCVGAVIGERLGLLPFEPKNVIAFAGSLLMQLRGRVGYRTIERSDYLSQFFIDNLEHTLMVGTLNPDESVVTVHDLPRKAVYIRAETAHGKAYLNNALIKRWCNERRIVLADFEMELRRRGGRPGVMKRMLANTQQASVAEAQKVWEVPIGNNIPTNEGTVS